MIDPRARPIAWVLRSGRPVSARLALAVAAGAGAAGSAIGLAAASAWLISRAAEQPPVLYLMVAVTSVRAFGISRGVLRYAERLLAHDAAFRVLATLRVSAYARLERLAPAGLAESRSGDLLARLVSDIDGLADVWLRVALPCAEAGLVGAAAALLVGMLVPAAGTLLALSLVAVAVAVPLAIGVVTRRAERAIAPARGELAAACLDLLAGAPEVLAAGATAARLDGLGETDARLAAAEARSAAGSAVGAFLASLAGGAATWGALVLGIAAVRDGSLGRVALAVVVLVPIAAHEIVAGIVPALQRIPLLDASAARVMEVLRRPDPVHEPRDPAGLPAGPYGIRIRDLRAGYPAGPDVLRGVELELPAGGRALVTGPSGSGKSTLAAVLLRFLDASGGSVQVTGAEGAVELSRLAEPDVRRVIGLCEQDPHVFDTTIAENVRLARPGTTDAELYAVLAAAHLVEWVDTLPRGIDTPVGEHGARMSGGQRQRLALARALLADVPILVLDEPTEHVDESTAVELTSDFLAATEGRTLIVMTHRPELMGATAWDVTLDLGSGTESRSHPPAATPPVPAGVVGPVRDTPPRGRRASGAARPARTG